MNNQDDFDLGAFLFIQDTLNEINYENNSYDETFDDEEEVEEDIDDND